jgi:formate/nitrite transporter FocA (FNT family)
MANKPVEIVQLAGDAGKYKANLGAPNFLARSFMAGLFIAVGGALCTVCSTGLENTMGPGFRALITGAVFPVGLIREKRHGARCITRGSGYISATSWDRSSGLI